jgi:hypothetical protein
MSASEGFGWRDLDAIHQLKARYFRYVDTKHWSKLRMIFTEDARFEGLWAAANHPDDFVTNLSRNLTEDVISVHRGFMPEIHSLGSEMARGIWAMSDYLTWEPGSRAYLGVSLPGQRGIRGYGHYSEEYQRVDGTWKISFLKLTRLRIDPIVDTESEMVNYPYLHFDDSWGD